MSAKTASWDRGKLGAYAVAIFGLFFILAGLIWLMVRFGPTTPLAEDRTALRLKNLSELRAAESAMMDQYSWRDQAKGMVRLPIQQAIALASKEWQDPAAARSNLIALVEKATAAPPKAPPPPNPYE